MIPKVKRLFKYLVFLTFFQFLLHFSYAQTQGNLLSVEITSPLTSDTLSVCLDTFPVTLTLINTTGFTLDSLTVHHFFPSGIFMLDSVAGVDSIDNSNPNQPLLFLDSIAGNGFASITLSAFAGCDFTDFYNNKNLPI